MKVIFCSTSCSLTTLSHSKIPSASRRFAHVCKLTLEFATTREKSTPQSWLRTKFQLSSTQMQVPSGEVAKAAMRVYSVSMGLCKLETWQKTLLSLLGWLALLNSRKACRSFKSRENPLQPRANRLPPPPHFCCCSALRSPSARLIWRVDYIDRCWSGVQCESGRAALNPPAPLFMRVHLQPPPHTLGQLLAKISVAQ